MKCCFCPHLMSLCALIFFQSSSSEWKWLKFKTISFSSPHNFTKDFYFEQFLKRMFQNGQKKNTGKQSHPTIHFPSVCGSVPQPNRPNKAAQMSLFALQLLLWDPKTLPSQIAYVIFVCVWVISYLDLIWNFSADRHPDKMLKPLQSLWFEETVIPFFKLAALLLVLQFVFEGGLFSKLQSTYGLDSHHPALL